MVVVVEEGMAAEVEVDTFVVVVAVVEGKLVVVEDCRFVEDGT